MLFVDGQSSARPASQELPGSLLKLVEMLQASLGAGIAEQVSRILQERGVVVKDGRMVTADNEEVSPETLDKLATMMTKSPKGTIECNVKSLGTESKADGDSKGNRDTIDLIGNL